MTKRKNSPGFKGHRFSPEIIEYAVWLYFRFKYRSHYWVTKFGRQYAKSIRRDRPAVGDKWHPRKTRSMSYFDPAATD